MACSCGVASGTMRAARCLSSGARQKQTGTVCIRTGAPLHGPSSASWRRPTARSSHTRVLRRTRRITSFD
eukprot:4356866-Prymnesium_polylepis.1